MCNAHAALATVVVAAGHVPTVLWSITFSAGSVGHQDTHVDERDHVESMLTDISSRKPMFPTCKLSHVVSNNIRVVVVPCAHLAGYGPS